jgi:tetratricopeptide (TPR) repeat protein
MPGTEHDETLLVARSAVDRRAWTEALTAFRVVDAHEPLAIDDLERAGLAAHLTGHDAEAVDLLSRAHRAAVDAGDPARGARGAFWLGMMLGQLGDGARASGWMGRAARLLEEHGIDTVERGYLLVPQGLQRLDARDVDGAFALFTEAGRIAERFRETDLATMSRLGCGRALVDRGEIARGVALLDEAMLAVTSDEVSPIVVGIVYCASIEIFQSIFDLRRAQAWTEALRTWCETQPDLVPFRGRCLLYRAEILQLHGAWSEAIDEARRAQEWLSRPPPEPAVGEAYYQRAELHRLRGEVSDAEAAYRAHRVVATGTGPRRRGAIHDPPGAGRGAGRRRSCSTARTVGRDRPCPGGCGRCASGGIGLGPARGGGRRPRPDGDRRSGGRTGPPRRG